MDWRFSYYIFRILVVMARFLIGDINKYGAAVKINEIEKHFNLFSEDL